MSSSCPSSIDKLLIEVLRQYNHYQNLLKTSGEEFNIFNILRFSRKEVRLHSALIGELLNTHGSHRQDDYFLKQFLAMIEDKHKHLSNSFSLFNTSESLVHLEYNMGEISNEGTTGGRIDIRISDHKSCIIIENKIDAQDVENQLLRYNNVSNKIALIYLTLHGREPTPFSTKGMVNGVDYSCISYKEDIVNWLKNSVDKKKLPLFIDNTIRQYINLLDSITNYGKMHDLEKNILDTLLSNDENTEASFHVANYWKQAKKQCGDNIFQGITERLRDIEFDYDTYEGLRTFPRIEFYPKDWKNHLIGFTEDHGLFYGIKRRDHKIQPISYEELQNYTMGQYRSANWWLCYSNINGDTFDPAGYKPYLQKNYDQVVNVITEKVIELYNIYQGCKDRIGEW